MTKSLQKSAKECPLILVDGSAYLYRAYHALTDLTAPDGFPTGAIFGVINMLYKLQETYPNSPFAIVFDAKGDSFRKEIDANYKSHRKPMPDALKLQIKPLHACVKALGFNLLCVKNVEADDVIGTLAKKFEHHIPVLICSGDKDMAQLVNDNISLYDAFKNIYLDARAVKEKFGVKPELIVDFLALMGDSSDNIPGVSGIGSVSAQKLLNAIGDLDTIYQDLTVINDIDMRGTKSIITKLVHEKDKAYLSRQLATIKTDVELDLNLDDLYVKPTNLNELRSLYQQLGFNKWLRDLGANTTDYALPAFSYRTVFTTADLTDIIYQIKQAKICAFDVETTSLDAHTAKLVGFSLATNNLAAYIPLAHDYPNAPKQLNSEQTLSSLQEILADPTIIKITHNGKYDANVLAHTRPNIKVQNINFDSMLESYVLNPSSQHDLDSLAAKHLGHTAVSFTDIAGKGSKQLTFNQIDIETAANYAAEDAYLTWHLHQHFWSLLQKDPDNLAVLQNIEMPLLPILAEIEQNGVLIDQHLLNKQSADLADKMTELTTIAYDLAECEFNLSSPKQLAEVLYDKLKLPIPAVTETGKASTNEKALHELANLGHKLPQIILQYRTLDKLKSTYTDKLPQQINQRTGRVHTSYHQAGTSTGRLSSANPNLQNIPVKTAEGRKIRQAFIAPQGYKIVAADYSQIELRVMAHIANDTALLDAFNAGEDIHQATAAQIFAINLDEVTKEQRRSAKAINFGLIYGMGAFGLAKQLAISNFEAKSYINNYFAKYAGVANYMENIRNQANQDGFVRTMFGRKIYIPNLKTTNNALKQAALRAAINAPIQGSAADIIKLAMLNVNTWLQNNDLDMRMIMQVHDELVFEVRNEHLEQAISGIKNCMANAANLRVPLTIDVGFGDNWDEAH